MFELARRRMVTEHSEDSSSFSAVPTSIFVRVIFPKGEDYPAQPSQVVELDATLTVAQAVAFLQKHFEIELNTRVGLYVTQEKVWLEDSVLLRDCKYLEDEPALLEYKVREAPDLGNIRARRRAKLVSPEFNDWKDSFKLSMKKREDAKKRDAYLKEIIPDLPVSRSPPRRRMVATPDSPKKKNVDPVIESYEMRLSIMEESLTRREEDARLAAEIGTRLLNTNLEMRNEMKILQERLTEKEGVEIRLQNVELELGHMETKNNILEAQIKDAFLLNSRLSQDYEAKANELFTIKKQQLVDLQKQREQLEEIDALRRELEAKKSENETLKRMSSKFKTERSKLTEQLDMQEGELKERDLLEKDSKNKMQQLKLYADGLKRELENQRLTNMGMKREKDKLNEQYMQMAKRDEESRKEIEKLRNLVQTLQQASKQQ